MLVCLTVDESLDPVVLLPGLEADEVHAPLPVDIIDIIDIVDIIDTAYVDIIDTA